MENLSVPEKDESWRGTMAILFRHEIVVTLDEQSSIFLNFHVDEFQTTQDSFAFLFADGI